MAQDTFDFTVAAPIGEVMAAAKEYVRPQSLMRATLKGYPLGNIVTSTASAMLVEIDHAYGSGRFTLEAQTGTDRETHVHLELAGFHSTSSGGFGRGLRDGDLRRYVAHKMAALARLLQENPTTSPSGGRASRRGFKSFRSK